MPKTAIVINPWVVDFKLYDEWMHPLGLYFLISLLRHNNYEVHFFDCLQRTASSRQKRHNTGDFGHREFPKPQIYCSLKRKYKIYGQPPEALGGFLSGVPRPDAIFIGSAMTYWMPGLVETAHAVSRRFPDTPMVIGGIAAKLVPQSIHDALPDAFVFEGALFDEASLKQSGIPVLRELQSDSWDRSMLPAFEAMTHAHHGPLLSSLGCPMSCSYCASKALQSVYRRRNTDTVLGELEYLQSHFGVRDFAVYDDAFLHGPKENFFPLIKAISQREIRAHFHTPNGLHAKWLTPEILDVMRESGFCTLRLGYESGSARWGADTSAKASRKDLAECVALVLERGFAAENIGVYVMGGLYNQTPEEMIREIGFAASLGVKAKPVFLSPVPRTALFAQYVKLFPRLAHDPLFHNDSFFITQLPGWDAATVQRIIDIAGERNRPGERPARSC